MHCEMISGNGFKDLLPGRQGSVGCTAKDNRLFVEAVLYRYRAGIPWRDLPETVWGLEKYSSKMEQMVCKWCWGQNIQIFIH